jgi:hypothetical protein
VYTGNDLPPLIASTKDEDEDMLMVLVIVKLADLATEALRREWESMCRRTHRDRRQDTVPSVRMKDTNIERIETHA